MALPAVSACASLKQWMWPSGRSVPRSAMHQPTASPSAIRVRWAVSQPSKDSLVRTNPPRNRRPASSGAGSVAGASSSRQGRRRTRSPSSTGTSNQRCGGSIGSPLSREPVQASYRRPSWVRSCRTVPSMRKPSRHAVRREAQLPTYARQCMTSMPSRSNA